MIEKWGVIQMWRDISVGTTTLSNPNPRSTNPRNENPRSWRDVRGSRHRVHCIHPTNHHFYTSIQPTNHPYTSNYHLYSFQMGAGECQTTNRGDYDEVSHSMPTLAVPTKQHNHAFKATLPITCETLLKIYLRLRKRTRRKPVGSNTMLYAIYPSSSNHVTQGFLCDA